MKIQKNFASKFTIFPLKHEFSDNFLYLLTDYLIQQKTPQFHGKAAPVVAQATKVILKMIGPKKPDF